MKRTRSSLHRAHSRGSFDRLLFESEHSNGIGGHRDRGFIFRCCQLLVLLLRLVTPFSYLYLSAIAYLSLCEYQQKYSCNTGDDCTATTADAESVVSTSTMIVGFAMQWMKEMKSHSTGCIFYYALLCWMIAEALFFPYYYNLFNKMHDLNDGLPHFATCRESRLRLVKNCFEALQTSTIADSSQQQQQPELYLRQVIEGWFLDEPIVNIHHANFASWTAWAFFGKDVPDMSRAEIDENEEIVAFVESQLHWKFPPGLNAAVPPVRLNLDPIFATQRPLFFYAAIAAVNCAVHVLLLRCCCGFRQLKKFDTPMNSQRIYYRPATADVASTDRSNINSSNNNNSNDSNNSNNNSSGNDCKGGSKGIPVVFVHGIGIGFAHYFALIAALPTEVDVYLIEWPYVAMQMVARGPSKAESVGAITAALFEHGHKEACIVAHSLGTVLVPWLLNDAATRDIVAGSVLLDPVTFLLCDPTVATMFVYKDPTNTVDFLMHFFLSRELFIANALSRYFAWSLNILFVEDLQRKHYNNSSNSSNNSNNSSNNSNNNNSNNNSNNSSNNSNNNNSNNSNNTSTKVSNIEHSIILSSHDVIVPIAAVSRYLAAKAKKLGPEANFEVATFSGTHGEMLLHPRWLRIIDSKVRLRCGLSPAAAEAAEED